MRNPIARSHCRSPAPVVLIAALLAGTGGRAQMRPEPATDEWKFSVGMGVFSGPRYPGSSKTKLGVVPIASANYGRYFIGGVPSAGVPLGIGAYLVQGSTWRLGVAVGRSMSGPRDESDSPRLRGMGDIDGTTLGAVFGSYSDKWLGARLGVLTDIGGHDHGTRVGLDLEARYKVSDQMLVSAGPGFTWADPKYTQTFFGVSDAQSLASGLAVYRPDGGINSIRFNVAANYQLTPQWGVAARVSLARLRGDAVDSPITEKKSQNTIGVFTSYLF